MANPVENEGTENNNPAGQTNAAGTAPAMQSITGELEIMVSMAGDYTEKANFMNDDITSYVMSANWFLGMRQPYQGRQYARISLEQQR